MRVRFVLACCVLAALPHRLTSQSSVPGPGDVVQGQVSVHVHVTLGDSADPYYPIADHDLILYRSTGDSVKLRTDDVGVARFLVTPGRYGLISAAPARWQGQSYAWSVPIDVRAGMHVIDLTLGNAMVVETPRPERSPRAPERSRGRPRR